MAETAVSISLSSTLSGGNRPRTKPMAREEPAFDQHRAHWLRIPGAHQALHQAEVAQSCKSCTALMEQGSESAVRPNDRFMVFSIIEKATPEITLITLRVI
jgi:hypothetical protein